MNPTLTYTAPELDAVLHEVNQIRTSRGADPLSELPKGAPCKSRGCPIQRALADIGSDSVGPYGTTLYTRTRWLRLPRRESVGFSPVLRGFVMSFDLHEYPELIA